MGLIRTTILGAAALACTPAPTPAAQAQDFFSALFGGFGRARAPYVSMPFANDDGSVPVQRGPRYAAARRFVSAPATAVISRSPHPTMPAGLRPATASARRA